MGLWDGVEGLRGRALLGVRRVRVCRGGGGFLRRETGRRAEDGGGRVLGVEHMWSTGRAASGTHGFPLPGHTVEGPGHHWLDWRAAVYTTLADVRPMRSQVAALAVSRCNPRALLPSPSHHLCRQHLHLAPLGPSQLHLRRSGARCCGVTRTKPGPPSRAA